MIFTLGLFGCDYASKSAAKASLEGADAVPIAEAVLHGAVELRYVENKDIAFNAFETLGLPHSPGILVGLSCLAIVGIVGLAMGLRSRRAPEPVAAAGEAGSPPARPDERTDPLAQAGLALVVAGALGNLLDRVTRGYVIDFIHVKGWPVFNVADIAVVVGMGLFFLAQLRRRKRGGDPGAIADPES